MAFRLFNHIDQLNAVTTQPAAKNFYTLLEKLRTAAKTPNTVWSAYPNFVDYAQVCFWAIRKHEYSFIAESFAQIEAQAGHPLRVLDVGCGVVPMCNWISSRGHDVTAFDPLREDIEFLVKNDVNRLYGSNVHYQLNRGEQLPFADATFDVVTCVSVLEHITPGNDLLTLWEIARVLKPGGSLLITFDVSPDPVESLDTDAKIDLRGIAAPFTMRTAGDLLTQLAQVFAVSPADLPAELGTMTWEDVFRLWRAVQQHDERSTPERYYLAMGNVLRRREQFTPMTKAQLNLAYLRAEDALGKRIAFFEYHASERYKKIELLSAANAKLRSNRSVLVAPLKIPVRAVRNYLNGRRSG